MLSSLSGRISRTPSAGADAPPTKPLADVIDLTVQRSRRREDTAEPGLCITPELLAALAGSWSGRD